MRALFALSVGFALLWAATGIASSWDQAEYRADPFGYQAQGFEPKDSYITLLALNHIGYSGGVGSLVIMGAGLMIRGHQRLLNRGDGRDGD